MNIPIRQYLSLIVDYLRPQRLRFILMAVLLLSGLALQLFNPQLMRYVIDSALAKSPMETVTAAAIFFFLAALAQQALGVLTTYVSETIAWTATNALRHDLAKHALTLDQSYHNVHTPGEMIERIDGDITILSNFFSQFIIQVVGNVLLLTGVLILFLREDWRVCLAITVFVIAALVILGRLRNIGVPHWKAARQVMGEMYGFIEERLAGTQDIRSNGAVPYIMRRFYELGRRVLHSQIRAALVTNMMVNSTFVLFAVGNAVAFAAGASLYFQGAISLGTVYLIFYYSNLINRPLDIITQQLQDLQQAGASIGRIKDLTSIQPSITEGALDTIPSGPLTVDLDTVTFGYDTSETILENFSLSIKAGRVIGLLGRTGSGKTTITRLILRLYDPQSGVVRLNGIDVRDLRFQALRQSVSMVTQNVQLFNATVRENLTLFDESISDDIILAAIRDLGLESWLNSLPAGLDTLLASGGGGLSAGEAQLLAFTRIFLKNPGLVILDEASSRLDPATEQLLEHAIDKLTRNRTAIIIAHRLATVTRADEIVIIDDGQIIEQGDREALAANPESRFAQLLQIGLEEVLS